MARACPQAILNGSTSQVTVKLASELTDTTINWVFVSNFYYPFFKVEVDPCF